MWIMRPSIIEIPMFLADPDRARLDTERCFPAPNP
jgi:hypothetical protein